MQNFDFYNPTRILFGQGQIAALATQIPAGARVLMLYGGGSIRQNGVYDEVMAALDGHTVLEFSGIEPNPSFENLMRAVELVRAERVEFLLAVGGGSVIDGTKFVAAAAGFTDDPWLILQKWGSNVEAALPFGVVLTLPATGSEMNCHSVVTRKATQEKRSFASPHIFPKFSILDPAKTTSLPPRQVGNGVVDAFAHVMEQYLTYPVGAAVQDRFAEGLLLTLIEQGPLALSEPDNVEVRANVMWCATLALNGLIGSGVPHDWATHMVGHELTALFNLDHAQTLAIVMPNMLRVRRESKRAKLLQYAERVWNLTRGDEDTRIEAALVRTEAFFEQMGVKTQLSDYGLGAPAIDAVVAALEAHRMVKLGEQRDVTAAVSRQVLELSLGAAKAPVERPAAQSRTIRNHFADGTLRTELTLLEIPAGHPGREGSEKEWAQSGQQIRETVWTKGYKVKEVLWYMNGSMKERTVAASAGQDASVAVERFWDNGLPQSTETCKGQRLVGTASSFDQGGRLVKEELYDQRGVLTARREFDQAGALVKDEQFHEDGSRKVS